MEPPAATAAHGPTGIPSLCPPRRIRQKGSRLLSASGELDRCHLGLSRLRRQGSRIIAPSERRFKWYGTYGRPNGLAFSCRERAARDDFKKATISRTKRSTAMLC